VSRADLIESLFRTILRTTGALSPKLGGKLALDLFCTPFAAPLSSGAETFLAAADRHDVAWSGGTVTAYEVGEGPGVMLVHGWSAHGASMRAFAPELVARGRKVILVDLPAHGASSGRRTTMIDASRALAAVLIDRGPVTAAITHSFGAPAMLLTLEREDVPPLESFVTVGAPTDMSWIVGSYCRRFAVPSRAEASMRLHIDATFGAPFAEHDPARMAAAFGERLLVVHDRQDRDVDVAQGRVMAGDSGLMLETDGLGHSRVLRDPEVVRLVGQFLDGEPIPAHSTAIG